MRHYLLAALLTAAAALPMLSSCTATYQEPAYGYYSPDYAAPTYYGYYDRYPKYYDRGYHHADARVFHRDWDDRRERVERRPVVRGEIRTDDGRVRGYAEEH